jgi:hypothetical protein
MGFRFLLLENLRICRTTNIHTYSSKRRRKKGKVENGKTATRAGSQKHVPCDNRDE